MGMGRPALFSWAAPDGTAGAATGAPLREAVVTEVDQRWSEGIGGTWRMSATGADNRSSTMQGMV